MPHISAEVAQSKPVEVVKGLEHLGTASAKSDADAVVAALRKLVDAGEGAEGADADFDVRHGVHAPFHELWSLPLVHRLVPGLEELANKYHFGNFVIVRDTGERIFESMPIYPR